MVDSVRLRTSDVGPEVVTAEDRHPRSIGPFLLALSVAAPALSPVLTTWANNISDVPNLHRLAIVAGLYLVMSFAVFWIARRLVGDPRIAAFISFFVTLVLTSGGRMLGTEPWVVRWVVAIATMSAIILIILRLRRWWLLDVIIAASAVALLFPPLLTGSWSTITSPQPPEAPLSMAPLPGMTTRPDIFLVILDAYTSLPVIEEMFGYKDPQLRADLSRNGVEVVQPAISPYSMTYLSVPSFLDLDYVLDEGEVIAGGRSLPDVIGGDNRLVDVLSHNGYQITMVEPGWHMSSCGPQVDVCVSDPFIDEGVDAVLSQGMLWSLIEPSVGSAFTHGARQSMAWATDNVERLAENGRPDFAFVHVIAPHPPLFMDSQCDLVSEDRRIDGRFVEITGLDGAEAKARIDGYIEQVRCVDGFVRRLTSSIAGTDSVAFISGDHGSDALSQLSAAPAQWSEPQLIERMSTFTAVKAPPECGSQTSVVTIAIFRDLISCSTGLDLEPIETQAFVVSRTAVDGHPAQKRSIDESEVRYLAACLSRLGEDLECR
jgi:Sulfatase